jgi:hypothetical protein
MQKLHAAFSWARANNPLGRAVLEGFDPFWAVTKHVDVMHVGRNNDLFHNPDRSTVLFDQATLQHIRTITGGDPNLVRSLADSRTPIVRSDDVPSRPLVRTPCDMGSLP